MSNNNAVVIQYLETLRGICSLLEKISYDETGTCVDDVIEALKQSIAQPQWQGEVDLGYITQPQAPVVPEGWRLVPIKLDVFMALFLTSLKHREKVSAQKMWDEILSVVPTPTPEPAQRDAETMGYINGLIYAGNLKPRVQLGDEGSRVLNDIREQIDAAIALQSSGKKGV